MNNKLNLLLVLSILSILVVSVSLATKVFAQQGNSFSSDDMESSLSLILRDNAGLEVAQIEYNISGLIVRDIKNTTEPQEFSCEARCSCEGSIDCALMKFVACEDGTYQGGSSSGSCKPWWS